MVPSSTSVLLDILEHNFPHKRLDVETHRCYLSNILQVASYCEALKSSILGLAIKNILQIDVRRDFISFHFVFCSFFYLFYVFLYKRWRSRSRCWRRRRTRTRSSTWR
jgi:hypothetical protein